MIFITGATGFIGSHLLPRLALHHKLRCLVRPSSKSRLFSHPNIEIIEGNLDNPESIASWLSGIDCVIHLAAVLRKKNPNDIFRINAGATQVMVDASKRAQVKHVIYLSTENTLRADLTDAYAESKRRGETIVRLFENSLILQPCMIFGAGENHGLGRLIQIAENNVVVPLFGGLKSQTQPLYIDDMVEYLLRAVENKICGTFVVAGNQPISLNDFVKKVCEIKKTKRFFVYVPKTLYRFLAFLGDHYCPSLGWGDNQLRNIYESQTHPIDETIKAFSYEPLNLEVALRKWLVIAS